MKPQSNSQWIPVIVAAGAMFLIFIDSMQLPTETDLQQSSSEVVTPCSYFCGPWYTWMVTWLVVIFILVFLAGVAIRVFRTHNGAPNQNRLDKEDRSACRCTHAHRKPQFGPDLINILG